MYLQIKSANTLAHLDGFLRFAWVECCGHLSHFIINDTFYESYPSDIGFGKPKSMNYKISRVLEKDMSFSYEYDFGTTTTLDLKVIDVAVPPIVPSTSRSAQVKSLAIHDPVKFVCDNCGAEATKICSYCGLYDFGGLACDTCIKTHKCCVSDGEEIALPVVQSPRTGQCAYVRPTFT